jgi:hypothetical protein
MMKSGLLFVFLSSLTIPSHGQTAQVPGCWRQDKIKWTKPPAELHLNERFAEAGLLYFGPNNQFALVYGTVIQGPTSETLSNGDGRVVYLGTWKFDGSVVLVEYRLVSRTVLKEGEILPGPIEEKTLQWRGGILLFDKTRFQRDKRLDDQLLSVLQGESARARVGLDKASLSPRFIRLFPEKSAFR